MIFLELLHLTPGSLHPRVGQKQAGWGVEKQTTALESDCRLPSIITVFADELHGAGLVAAGARFSPKVSMLAMAFFVV